MPGGAGVVVKDDLGGIGLYLENWRAERDMLINDVVRAAPVSRATLVKLRYPQRHEYTPSLRVIRDVAEWLHLSPQRVARMVGPDAVAVIEGAEPEVAPEPDYGGLRRSKLAMTALGDLIEDVRLARRHKIKAMADEDKLGIYQTSLARIRAWPPRPLSEHYIPMLCGYLGISADEVLRLHELPGENVEGVLPSEEVLEYPIQTMTMGRKIRPAVQRDRGCDGCPYYDDCVRDVLRGGWLGGDFAWCERITSRDVKLPEEEEDEVLSL